MPEVSRKAWSARFDLSRATGQVCGVGRRLLFRTAAVALGIVVSVALAEVLARVVIGLSASEAQAERRDFAARIPGSGPNAEDSAARRMVQTAYGARFELHPFFGFTSARGEGDANRHGFPTGGVEYPYEAAPGEFVVGIFGGSVAMQLAGFVEPFEETIAPTLAAKGYDRVTTLSFAGGAWRQPQSLYAFLYFLRSIDAAVVLDGFNEIIQLNSFRLEDWPAEFPAADIYAPLAQGSAYDAAAAGKLMVLNDLAGGVSAAFDAPVVRSSVLVHLAWRGLASWYLEETAGLREKDATKESTRSADPAAIGSPPQQVQRYFRAYEDATRSMYAVGRDRGLPVLQFVQPNQYDRGSKPLSKEEREDFTGADWFEHVTAGYERLEDISARLRRDGVESHYLGDVFLSEEETMYSDDCCHLNEEGLRRIGVAIGEAFIASPQVRALPAVGDPNTSP